MPRLSALGGEIAREPFVLASGVALSLGASHAATGTGTVAISSPAGLRITFTTVPAFLGFDSGQPREYYRLGRVNVGNVWGFLPHVEVVCSPQIVLDLPPGLTVLAWDFAPGVVGSIDELVDSVAAVSLQPWDRTPMPVGNSVMAQANGGTATTTSSTYTVPAGRRLVLTSAETSIERLTVATTQGTAISALTAGGVAVCDARMFAGPAGSFKLSQQTAAGMIVNPGQQVVSTYSNSDTAGAVLCRAVWSGFLFDA